MVARQFPSRPAYLDALCELCEREGYACASADPLTGHVLRISSGSKFFFTGAGRVSPYPLNAATLVSLTRDKAHSAAILKQAGFTTAGGRHFFLRPDLRERRPDGHEFADAFPYAEALGYPVFVKPVAGTGGKGAGAVFDAEALAYRLQSIAAYDWAAIVQPVQDGREFRLFLIDGAAQFLYEKRKPSVTGDGHRTLGALMAARFPIDEAGRDPYTDARQAFETFLSESGRSLSSIPADGEVVALSSIANVSSVGDVHGFHDVPGWMADWAADLFKAFPLRVIGIDLFVDRLEPLPDTPPVIIELNGAPATASLLKNKRHDLFEQVWRKVMSLYFSGA